MNTQSPQASVPLVPEMIHRPDEPRHMMRVKPLDRPLRVQLGDQIVAESRRALQVIEIGRDVYDPVYYVPVDDVRADLQATEKSTHCPLKGDTTYYDVQARNTDQPLRNGAWAYTSPLPFANELKDHAAFDASSFSVTLMPR